MSFLPEGLDEDFNQHVNDDNDRNSNQSKICEPKTPGAENPLIESCKPSQAKPNENSVSMKEVTGHWQEAHPNNGGYTCLQCLKTYKSASCLGMHVKAKYSLTLNCDRCTMAFADDSQLRAHKKKHTQQKEWLYPNNTCPYAFSTKKDMGQHRQIPNEYKF